jgi:PhzF family phenazine biosynthesis protein
MPASTHRFDQLDVFTAVRLKGNPLAVVHGAEGLSAAQMQALAAWTHLSETTFLLPPTPEERAAGADYHVRIFTPGGELPFAGHPTLGSCHAWLAAGGRPQQAGRVVQACGAGLVPIRTSAKQPQRLAFAAPPLRRSGPLDEALLMQIVSALSLPRSAIVQHQWVDNGPGWCAVMLKSAEAVLALRPDAALLGNIKLGVCGPHPLGAEAQWEVRAFAPGLGVPEDPVTGSLNAGLAAWLIAAGLAPTRYVAAQGAAIGRAGRIDVEQDAGTLWIGGDVTPVVRGHVDLG